VVEFRNLATTPAIGNQLHALQYGRLAGFQQLRANGIMTDKFTSALLAALNESAEIKESDWSSLEAVLRGPIDAVDAVGEKGRVGRVAIDTVEATDAVEPVAPVEVRRQAAAPQTAENRFAATISSGMAKIRSGR
jgi:hypothetical protein